MIILLIFVMLFAITKAAEELTSERKTENPVVKEVKEDGKTTITLKNVDNLANVIREYKKDNCANKTINSIGKKQEIICEVEKYKKPDSISQVSKGE